MPKKILVVDDVVENIQLVSSILKKSGYSILVAKNGKKALEIVAQQSVDLILLDIVMPEMDGFEVARRLKSTPEYRDIPIVFLTSHADASSVSEGFAVGAQDYVSKPFNASELKARVATHLELSDSRKELKRNLDLNISLLDQYKTVVDESTIVSKTDPHGIITYVNDAFVRISGYSREELLGHPHSIVRHSDMPKSAFKEMWETIRAKKTWKGEVKNRKKDGGYYIVQSTISPILGADGAIEEYISARNDVTEIYDLQKEIEETQKEVVFTMGSIGETRSKETGNHVKRVAEYSRILATHCGLDAQSVELLVQASPMHDIGKVGIPDNILQKPGKLDDDEYAVMRTHAELGHSMLAHSKRPLLQMAATVAHEHHEWWDGTGYPRYLKGEEISIYGRITALADVFDALGSDRCYKKAWSDERIFELLRAQRGMQFDPQLIDLFFEHLDAFLAVRERFRDL
ncbi:MAG: response regulator [Campylobacterales bacterium]|nr:response regulator [Campylobacterales bacterium]